MMPIGWGSRSRTGAGTGFDIRFRFGLCAARAQGDPGTLPQVKEEKVARSEIRGPLDRTQVAAFITQVFKCGHRQPTDVSGRGRSQVVQHARHIPFAQDAA